MLPALPAARSMRRGAAVVRNVDTELLDLMLEHGADVNAQVTGAASYSGRIARALTGDPVNTKSNEGMTALHVAVRSRNASSCAICSTRERERTSRMRREGRRSMCSTACRHFSPRSLPMRMASCLPIPMPLLRPAPAPAGAGRAGGAGAGAGGRGGGGNPAAVEEIRTMLQGAPQNQSK